jgi:hypothetical protein
VRTFRAGEEEQAADYDASFWDRIPFDELAKAVWELSAEVFSLTDPRWRESGLPRSALRLQRR